MFPSAVSIDWGAGVCPWTPALLLYVVSWATRNDDLCAPGGDTSRGWGYSGACESSESCPSRRTQHHPPHFALPRSSTAAAASRRSQRRPTHPSDVSPAIVSRRNQFRQEDGIWNFLHGCPSRPERASRSRLGARLQAALAECLVAFRVADPGWSTATTASHTEGRHRTNDSELRECKNNGVTRLA